jgi:MFS family permease
MERSLWAVLLGTFTLRFSTALTGTTLLYYLADLPKLGGPRVDPSEVGVLVALFFSAELILSTPFGILSDRWGHHRVMQFGPMFGAVAVLLTWATTDLVVIGGTRLLEGASTAASVPSILGYIALVTARDESLRGRASARFEGATLAGIGAGAVAAGILYGGVGTWEGFGRDTFLLNAVLYGLSFLIYRLGVTDPRAEGGTGAPHLFDFGRYRKVLASSHVWLLAPTWIAINAALGLWTTQSIFQLVRERDPRFGEQLLMGGFDPAVISAGLAAALVVFFLGLVFWGDRFKLYRRTTIIFVGIAGGAVVVVGALLVNHSAGLPDLVRVLFAVVVIAGLFVLSGATPAALGLLADVSERHPHDRGAIMGLYSVFLAVGQIGGSLIGGQVAKVNGIDAILVLTLVLLAVALIPLWRLREFEHELSPSPDVPPVELELI